MIAASGLLSSTAFSAEQRYLVAVGNNTGVGKEIRLAYAEKDARRYADALMKMGQIPAGNIELVQGQGKSGVLNALRNIAQKARQHAREDVTLFFYYSGHGTDDELHLRGDRLSLRELTRALAKIPSGLRVAVIDACRSDSDVNYKGFQRKSAFAVQLVAPPGIQGVVTLKSSSAGEASQESDSLRGAVFTHYLLTAMRGAADRDRDHAVTLDEAYQYAYRQTVQRSAESAGNIMHPSVELDVEGAGQLVLTRPPLAEGSILLPRQADVKFLLYNKPSGAIVAEVWGDPERTIAVRVAAGRYLIQRRGRHGHGAYEFQVAASGKEEVSLGKFHEYPPETLAAKGGHLDVWRHELKTGYGAFRGHHGGFAQRIRAVYGYGAAMWSVSLGAEAGTTNHSLENLDSTERWVGAEALFSMRRLLGPFDLSFGGATRVIEQRLKRQDLALLGDTDFETEETHLGLAAGPVAGIGWRFFLSPRWFLSAELTAFGWLRGEGDAIVFRPEGGAEMMLGVDL